MAPFIEHVHDICALVFMKISLVSALLIFFRCTHNPISKLFHLSLPLIQVFGDCIIFFLRGILSKIVINGFIRKKIVTMNNICEILKVVMLEIAAALVKSYLKNKKKGSTIYRRTWLLEAYALKISFFRLHYWRPSNSMTDSCMVWRHQNPCTMVRKRDDGEEPMSA